jgi:hypothetical protein
MISASQLLHAHLGAPAAPDARAIAPAPCWVCGAIASRAVPRERWMGANFTGQNRVRAPASGEVCEACVVVMAGRPPDTLRMYSHLYEGGGTPVYERLNKGSKPAMRAFLRRSHAAPWFAAIADSGQKHIVPWTPVNPPSSTGRVLFEEDLIALPSSPAGWSVLDACAELLTAGATKEEVESGRYGARAYQLARTEVERFEREHGARLRGGAWFRLVVWLAQRDEEKVAARMEAEKEAKRSGDQRRGSRKATDQDGGVHPVRASGVPESGRVAAQALGSDPKQDAERGAAEHERGRMGDDALPRPPAPSAQLCLF